MKTNPKKINIVWFKKDLRCEDHKPLNVALNQGPTVGVFVIEDQWLKSPEFSGKHFQFALGCLEELRKALQSYGVPLLVKVGDVISVFSKLYEEWEIKSVFSHEETGLNWTFQRDIKFRNWCQERSISWQEFPQFAVIRGLKNRDVWNQRRNAVAARKPLEPPQSQNCFQMDHFGWDERPSFSHEPEIQLGGSGEAFRYLRSFLAERGEDYTKGMSTPVKAPDVCSRISPYLVWGAISLPQVQKELAEAQSQASSALWRSAYKSFESRLWWHCHFIQKLESEPEIEFQNFNRGFDGMREDQFNNSHFEAWKKGETGFPLIDACMRALIQTGWINFRMRALLISFASYQLWLHWRKPAQHLARLFTDFEPGIHFSQIQMQSGVTGINTIRIYSPVKQAIDQDPQAEFVRKYCPELESLPAAMALRSDELTPMEQTMYGVQLGRDYPEPIVDPLSSYSQARDQIYHWRKKPEVKKRADEVYQRHGSRKNSFFPTQHRKSFGNLKA